MPTPPFLPDYSARDAALALSFRTPNQLHNDRRRHDFELDLAAGELRTLPVFANEVARSEWYATHSVYAPKYAALKLPGRDWRYERTWIDALAARTTLEREVIFEGAMARAVKTLSEALGRPVRVVE